ncbi:MAG TPA: HAD-IIA family hydrolase [Candidatus Limnocylindria bacterium]|nr:HAD-IIA family hydrolase [Candidatus Limnocylindria bacterium]
MDALPARVELVIFDLDGVVYRGDHPVPGAAELIARLHRAGVVVRFATNNSMWTRRDYAARLRGMGIDAEPGEVVTSASATAAWLARDAPGVETLLAVGEDGLVREMGEAGYRVTPAAEAATDGDVDVPTREWDAVVAGLDRSFEYRRLALAAGAVRAGSRFVATNADRRYPTPRGFLPGAGSIVAAIAAAAEVEPEVIGKPQPGMFLATCEEARVPLGAALVVGDNPDADIVAARRAGIASVLVLTGVASAEAASRLAGERRPDAVVPGPDDVWDRLADRLA